MYFWKQMTGFARRLNVGCEREEPKSASRVFAQGTRRMETGKALDGAGGGEWLGDLELNRGRVRLEMSIKLLSCDAKGEGRSASVGVVREGTKSMAM